VFRLLWGWPCRVPELMFRLLWGWPGRVPGLMFRLLWGAGSGGMPVLVYRAIGGRPGGWVGKGIQ